MRTAVSSPSSEMVLVAGDFNSGRGSATRAVLGGLIDPPALISPRDCIDPEGMIACKLPEHSPFLVDLAGDDPDLRGQGSYRFGGKEEMIDGIFAASAAARAAREPGHAANDWDVTLIGRFFQGSDHRMLRVRLRF